MKRFLNLTILCAVVVALTGCKIKDTASISVEQEAYIVTAGGGKLVIPVTSTGIDDVKVDYREEYYEWSVDENGDKIPAAGWISLERIIHDYEPQTRELPSYGEGISLIITPNLSGIERQATLRLRSFNKEAFVTITQVAMLPLEQ